MPQNNHFLLGQNINIYKSETPESIYVEWMKQFPDAHFIRYLGLFNKEYLVPNSVAAHKAILQTNCYQFRKPAWFVRLTKEVGGHGILFKEGAEHKVHRKMLNPSFSLKSIRKLEPVFQSKSKDICGVLQDTIERGDGRTGVFNASEIYMKAILDIGMSAYSTILGTLSLSFLLLPLCWTGLPICFETLTMYFQKLVLSS